MSEQNADTTPTTETASNGDPSLGPSDVRFEITLTLLGQREVLVQDDVSLKLSNALSQGARGRVVAAIESSVQLLVQNAVTRFNELVLQRDENAEKQIAGHGAGTQAIDRFPNGPTDFPDRLPPSPPKK